MTSLASTEELANNHLRNHLAFDLYAQLASTGTLPEAVLQAERARLRAELDATASYIPSKLVRAQLANPQPGRVHGAYWDGTVLFADLSGFTALSGTLSTLGKQGAEEVSAIISNLFTALVEQIHRYSGGLLKFGGNALTAFFDAATLGADHASLASSAAMAMQAHMAQFAALQTRAGTFALQLRIGIHSGKVFAAQVGNLSHIELVVTGRNINRVALAQEIARPGEVVISNATRALLHDVTTEDRQAGFALLEHMPTFAAPPTGRLWEWADARAGVDELAGLALRIDALRPYLPRGLPRRFLESPGGTAAAEVGEFRPVTMLFANFYPFSMALDLLGDDCETAVHVLNAYYTAAQDVVHRYGGIVNKVDMYTFGDKLMALFGAPLAHEDDPLRAARAALDLRGALAEANRTVFSLLQPRIGQLIKIEPQFLKQRIGLNTGVVFAGKVGAAHRHEYTVMGQPVNLSARLMSAAEEDTIIVSPATRRVIDRHIAMRDLAPMKFKGIDQPVPIAQALHLFDSVRDDRRGIVRPQLVGREQEMALMLDTARAALSGSGHTLALVGDAGVGKTRLIEDALQQMILLSAQRDGGIEPFFIYSAECQSYEQNTAYTVVRELMSQLFNLNLSSIPAEQIASVNRRVAELAPHLLRFAPLLGDMLNLSFEETPITAALSPEQRHNRLQDLVETLILSEARTHPLVLIIDDLHWADASSLDVLTQLVQRAPDAPLLLMLGYRLDPPIPEPWRALPICIRIEVRELSAASSTELVRALLLGEPPAELARLIEHTQGNPFFIEEVVRGLIESGALERTTIAAANAPARWRLTRRLDELAVPDSIEGVIIARLDRLEERSRDVLQVAAVVGRRFPYPVIAGVVTQQHMLSDSLLQLSNAELIANDEVDRDLAYIFRHGLTRDVAYEAILYARRRELHLRVARRIEEVHAERLDEQLALLARHYLLAEAWGKAFDYHLRAGRQAQQRYANREAITLLQQALLIGEKLTSSTLQTLAASALQAQIIELHERLGVVYALIGEYDAALERYQAALALLQLQPDATLDGLIRLHHHIARIYGERGDFETSLEWVERALALGSAKPGLELARCLDLGAGLHQRQGRYAQALEWGERALALAEQLDSTRNQASALKRIGGTYRNMGENTRALDILQRCLALYQQGQNLGGTADAHNDLANVCYELGMIGEARAHYEAGAEIKEAIGDVYGQAMIANNLGDLLMLQDDINGAIEQYQHSLVIFERLGSLYATGVLCMNLGASYLQRGDLDQAQALLGRSMELFNQAGAEDFIPELERYMARLHSQRGNLARALVACELSLSTALRLEARAEEGMTRRVLGELLALNGNPAGGWAELERSLALLRETAGPYEIARTLVEIAKLAPALGRVAEGRAAINEALPALRDVGALRALREATAINTRYQETS